MLDKKSLVNTVNAVNEALLLGIPINRAEATSISAFIAGRQGAPGNYGGLFGPAEGEDISEYRLFTGDATRITNASARHILGEESLRILRVLNVRVTAVQSAITKAQESFSQVLKKSLEHGKYPGLFCCGKCTVAYWRALATGWLPDADERFVSGMQAIRRMRWQGGWHRMPFFYTVLCLTELPPEITQEERKYVRPRSEQVLSRLKQNSPAYRSKAAILEKLILSLGGSAA